MTLKPKSQVIHLSELCSSPLLSSESGPKPWDDLVISALCPHLPCVQPGAFAVLIPCSEFSCLRKISEAVLLVKNKMKQNSSQLGAVAHIHNLCICESEAGGLKWVQGQLRLQRETWFHEHHQQQTPPGQTKLPLSFLRSLFQYQLLTETGLPIPDRHSLLGHITVCTCSTWPHTVSITNIQFNIHRICIIAQGHLQKERVWVILSVLDCQGLLSCLASCRHSINDC